MHFDPVRTRDVYADEDGYVVLGVDAWHYYARLFARNGIRADQALDTLEDFHDALSRCTGRRATVHKLPRA